MGYALSARHAAFTKNGITDSLTPCSFSMRSLIRERSASMALMSISLNVVRCAVACCDSSRCSAMRRRRVDIFSRVSRAPALAGVVAAAGAREGGALGGAVGVADGGADDGDVGGA